MNPQSVDNKPWENPGEATTRDRIERTADELAQKAREAGDAVKNKLADARGASANTLDRAASTLREKAESIPGGETTSHFARNFADKLEATADYLRRSDFQGMKMDAENAIRRRPGQSMLAAIAAGFLIGRAMRRRV
jgi:ElaB/YqjD/DUF883 family membrane-anchored ribosome-binding protein